MVLPPNKGVIMDMDDFKDLREVAAGAGNGFLVQTAKNTLKIFAALFFVGPLLAYMPVFGLTGWGIIGGIAGLLASLTLVFCYTEIRFLIKGD